MRVANPVFLAGFFPHDARRRAGCGISRRSRARNRPRTRAGWRKPTYLTSIGTRWMPSLTRSAAISSEAGLRTRQALDEIVEGEPGVDDVLDDQHVATSDLHVEVLEDADHTATSACEAPYDDTAMKSNSTGRSM